MDEIELTIIGCGDAFASGGKFHTCFYVRSESCNFLIDCGASAITSLKQQGIRCEDIDVVLISHFHGDHFGGLPFLLLDASVNKRKKPITIVSPPGGKEKVEKLFELLYPGSELSKELIVNYQEYHDSKVLSTSNLMLIAFPVKHKEATLPHGLRIVIDSKVISYSGDTEWTPVLENLAENADLFICECNFFESNIEGHMNYETLVEKIPDLYCKQILLTHFGEEMIGNLERMKSSYASDGMKIVF